MYRSLLPFVVFSLAIGCTPTEDEVDTDPDRDGLSTDFELLIGTNPESADSDGDGHFDAVEHLQYFDAMNDEDYPYEGGWARRPLPTSAEWDEMSAESGWALNDFSGSWSAEDQNGDPLELSRFYGNVILVDFGAEWCGPCRVAAETLPEEYEDRKDDGFVILQVVLDGFTPGDQSPDLERWAGDFDLEHTLIDGGEFDDLAGHYMPPQSGIPNYTIIDRNFVIRDWYQAGGEPDWSLIDELLEEDAPEVEWAEPENGPYLREFYNLPEAL